MKKYWFFVLSMSIFLSCAICERERKTPVAINVDTDNVTSLFRSELMELSEIIQLDIPENASLGYISRFRVWDDFYLVAGDRLAVFGKNGNFRSFIGQYGRGPGEYLSISGMAIFDKQVNVLDRTQQKVLVFSSDGSFVKEISLNFFGQAINEVKEGVVIYSGNEANENEMRLFWFDPGFNLKGAALARQPELAYLNIFDKTNFFLINNHLRFLWAYDNVIYSLISGNKGLELEQTYFVDFGENQIPDAFFDRPFSNIMEFEKAVNQTNYAGRISGFYENDLLVWFAFRIRGEFLWAIYSKLTGEVKVFDKLKDDQVFLNGEVQVLDEWFSMYFNGNKGYLVLEAPIFIDRVKKMKEQMNPVEWKSFLDSKHLIVPWILKVGENDPPLVLVFEMKS